MKIIKSVLSEFDVRYYLQHGTAATINQILIGVLQISLITLITRNFSTAVFGQYQFLLALIGMLMFTSLVGMKTAIVSSVTKGNDGVYQNAYKSRLGWSIGGGILLILYGLYRYFLHQDQAGIIILVGFCFPMIATADTWMPLFQAKLKFYKIAALSSLQVLMQLFLVMLLVKASMFDSEHLFFAYFVGFGVLPIFFLLSGKKLVENHRRDIGWREYGMFLSKLSVLETIVSRMDYILVGVFFGATELAIYAVGVKVALKFQNFLRQWLITITPKIAKKNTLNKKKYALVFMAAVFLCLMVAMMLPFLMKWLFPNKYDESIYLSQIVVMMTPFLVINNLYSKHFKYYSKNKKALAMQAIIAPILIFVLMIFMLPRAGMIGLAVVQGLNPLIYSLVILIASNLWFKDKVTH